MWMDSLECSARKGVAKDMVKQLGISEAEAFNRIDNLGKSEKNNSNIFSVNTLLIFSSAFLLSYIFLKGILK
jgi:uncharacterized membrane protein YfhO